MDELKMPPTRTYVCPDVGCGHESRLWTKMASHLMEDHSYDEKSIKKVEEQQVNSRQNWTWIAVSFL